MIGVPKHYNTASDLENAHSLALDGQLPPEPIKRAWQALLGTQRKYVFHKTLASEDDRTGPEPDYRVLAEQGESEDEIHEFELVNDPHGRIFKLGYTADEVQAKIEELEG